MAQLPAGTQERTSSRPRPSAEDVTITRTSGPTRRRARSRSRSSSSASQRSALVSTTTGSASQSSANTSERATRSSSTSPAPSACTISTLSTLEQSTWRSPRARPRQRSKLVWRGSTHSITPISCPGARRTATRSPTAGSRTSSSPRDLANPTACSARKVSSAVATSGNPRSKRTTAPSCICSGSSACAQKSSKVVCWTSSTGRSSNAGTSCSASSPGTLASSSSADAGASVASFRRRSRLARAPVVFFFALALALPTDASQHKTTQLSRYFKTKRAGRAKPDQLTNFPSALYHPHGRKASKDTAGPARREGFPKGTSRSRKAARTCPWKPRRRAGPDESVTLSPPRA